MAIFLAKISDVPEKKGIIVQAPDGREIALFKVDAKIYALDNECPHSGGPLGEGEVENCTVTCPWHAWQFNISTGECVNAPGLDAASIPIDIVGDSIFMSES